MKLREIISPIQCLKFYLIPEVQFNKLAALKNGKQNCALSLIQLILRCDFFV